jgi:Flp pilus assembly protein TadB
MLFIKIAFLTVFVLGMFFIVSPIVGRLAVGLMIMRRNRFYDKRRKGGRSEAEDKKNILQHPILLKLNEYLSIAEVRMPATYILTMSLLITIVVFLVCYKVMPAPVYDTIIGILFGGIPLLYCWSKYQKKNLEMASVMIPTVQNFIGYFTEADNLEGAIYKSARTVPFEISSEWHRLIMDLQTGEKPDKSLIQFAERVGNDWAHYFADILITHLDTGVDITSSLFKLINEMQNTMYNEEKRITLLTTYKWGTILMIGLSVFVVYFNIKMDPENEKYYFHDKTGIQIVTLAVVVLFISFIGAMQMGRKKL